MSSYNTEVKPSSILILSINSGNRKTDDKYHPANKSPTNFFLPYPLQNEQVASELRLVDVEIPNTFYNFRAFNTKELQILNGETLILDTQRYFTVQDFTRALGNQITDAMNTGVAGTQPLYGTFNDGTIDVSQNGAGKLDYKFTAGYRLCAHDFRKHLSMMFGEIYLGDTILPLLKNPIFTIPVNVYASGIQPTTELRNLGPTIGFNEGAIPNILGADDSAALLTSLGVPTTGAYFVAARQIAAPVLEITAENNQLVVIIGNMVYLIPITTKMYKKEMSAASIVWRNSDLFYIDPDEFYFPELSEAVYYASKAVLPHGYFINLLMRKYDLGQSAIMPPAVCDRFFMSIEYAAQPTFMIKSTANSGKLIGGDQIVNDLPYYGPFRKNELASVPAAFTSLVLRCKSEDLATNIALINTWYTSGGAKPALNILSADTFTVPPNTYTPTTLAQTIQSSFSGGVGFRAYVDTYSEDVEKSVIKFTCDNPSGESWETPTSVIVLMNYDADYNQLCTGGANTLWHKYRILSSKLHTGGKLILDGASPVYKSPYVVSETDLSPMKLDTGKMRLSLKKSGVMFSGVTITYELIGYYSVNDMITELNAQTVRALKDMFPGDGATQKEWEIQFVYTKSSFKLTIYGDRDASGNDTGVALKDILIHSDYPETDYSLHMYQMLGFKDDQVFVDSLVNIETAARPTCVGELPVSIAETEYCYLLSNLVAGKDNTYATTGDNINSILARIQIPANPGSYVMSSGGFPSIQVIGAREKLANIGMQLVLVDRYGSELQGVSNWSLSIEMTY